MWQEIAGRIHYVYLSLAVGDTPPLEVLTLSLKCVEPPDPDCQVRIADQIQSDRFVWGILNKKAGDESTVVGEVNFLVRGKGTSKAALSYSANLTGTLKRLCSDGVFLSPAKDTYVLSPSGRTALEGVLAKH